jgi:hypothetical protein
MSEEKKEIEVVNGDVKDLDISPVYDHIKSDTPKQEKPKEDIVIPKKTSNNNK